MPARVCLALALLLALAAPAGARVVLVGVDGGSWPLIDRGLAAGELPHIQALLARGVAAELESVEPLSSPPVWTSIATGRRPAAHGVTDFYRTRLDIDVPTLFERLAAQGRRVGLYDYLVSWPPPSLPGGFAIPGWLRRDPRVWPEDVFARAGVTPYVYSVEGVRTRDEFVAITREEIAEKPARFNALAEAFDLDLGAVTFYAADATGHRFWRAAFPEEFAEPPPPDEARYRAVVGDTLRGIDAALGRIAGALGPEDSLVVVSDHGFEARDAVDPVWFTHLEDAVAGTELSPEHGVVVDGEFFGVMVRVLPGPFAEREALLERLLERLATAAAPDGTPLFSVEVLDVAERPPEARRGLLASLRQWGVRRLLEWRFSIAFDKPAHAYVIALPEDAALRPLWPDGEIRWGGQTLPIRRLFHLEEFSGGHHPVGILLAAGGPLRHLPERGRASVLDVAPLLLHLAASPVPDDLEGRVPLEWLVPGARSVRRVPAAALPGLPRDAEAEVPADTILHERLRALGYLE